MGPRLPVLIAVLTSCLLPVRGCVLCDPKVKTVLYNLEKKYLPDHMDPKYHQNFMSRVKEFLKEFNDLQIDINSFMAVIDQHTLEKVSWSLSKDIKRMTGSEVEGELFVKEFFWMLKIQKDVFARHMARFQREVFCPNKCGTMLQTLIWCQTCVKQVHSCHKSLDCGERIIKVHRLEDLVLNCELSWHQAAEGLTNYRFYRVWKNNTETLVSEGKEPTLSKTMVGPEDEGKYRCVLGTVQNTPATILHFNVRVLPKRFEEETPPATADNFTAHYFLNATKNKHLPNTTGPALAEGTEETDAKLREPDSAQKLRKHLIVTLIWASAVLILGLVTAVLCFRSKELIEGIKFKYGDGTTPQDKAPRKAQGDLEQTDGAKDKEKDPEEAEDIASDTDRGTDTDSEKLAPVKGEIKVQE